MADEVVVDLMGLAYGIGYEAAAADHEIFTIGGISIPMVSLRTLIRTKNTVRPSDAADRRYLEELLRAEGDQK